jgi:hypothetical protein
MTSSEQLKTPRPRVSWPHLGWLDSKLGLAKITHGRFKYTNGGYMADFGSSLHAFKITLPSWVIGGSLLLSVAFHFCMDHPMTRIPVSITRSSFDSSSSVMSNVSGAVGVHPTLSLDRGFSTALLVVVEMIDDWVLPGDTHAHGCC